MKSSHLILFLILSCSLLHAQASLKPRIVVLTDPRESHEADDGQSLVRLLAYADLVEIEALIATTGWNWWSSSHIDAGYPELQEKVEAYATDLPNLMKRSGQSGFRADESRQPIGYWPSADYLRERTVRGMARDYMDRVGNGNDTAGSRLIVEVVDEEDPRPVWVLVWGGPSVLAQAVWDIAHNDRTQRSETEIAGFIEKLRVVAITDQDTNWSHYTGRQSGDYVSRNSGHWLRDNYPDLFWIKMEAPNIAFTGRSDSMKAAWRTFYSDHIQSMGTLGGAYPTHTIGIEGDTPSLFHVLPFGISDPEQPAMGGLGGSFRFGEVPWAQDNTFAWNDMLNGMPELPTMNEANTDLWREQLWHDFAARIEWAATGIGNRNPRAVLWQDASNRIIHLHPAPGETLYLDASSSTDPDGDPLSYRWFAYPYGADTAIPEDWEVIAGPQVEITLPADQSEALDLILEVRDAGDPWSLTAYRRILIQTDPTRQQSEPWSLASLPPEESAGWITDWMGSLYHEAAKLPWAYHFDFGWVYTAPDATAEGLWFYDLEDGWLWTARGVFPFVWNSAENAWQSEAPE